MELTIVHSWFAFSIIVGVAAHTRGRNELLGSFWPLYSRRWLQVSSPCYGD